MRWRSTRAGASPEQGKSRLVGEFLHRGQRFWAELFSNCRSGPMTSNSGWGYGAKVSPLAPDSVPGFRISTCTPV